jgi:hypothetical protein
MSVKDGTYKLFKLAYPDTGYAFDWPNLGHQKHQRIYWLLKKMKNNNNKLTVPWMRQLFKQSNLAPKVSRAKTYFAHRYRDSLAVVGDTPFNIIFSSSSKLPQMQEPDKSSIQPFFDHELS